MPDGQMLSFPIPVLGEQGISSECISYANITLEELFKDLGHKKTRRTHHLDPDLGLYCVNGLPSKCAGIFGQSSSAASHLHNQKVGVGDVFLFFGTFQHVEFAEGKHRYKKGETPFHAIFGYLVVSEVIDVIDGLDNLFATKRFLSHPHWSNRALLPAYKNNHIYIGNRYGTFKYSDELKLTKPCANKSLWNLPKSFWGITLSYHPRGGTIIDDKFELQTVAKGQEFVCSITDKTTEWIQNLVQQHG